MTAPTTPLITVLAALLTLTACTAPASPHPSGHPTAKPGRATGKTPALRGVDGSDPTVVSRAALRAMWSADTTIDPNHDAAALRRAAPYLHPRYRAQLRHTPHRPSAEWERWRRHRAYTRVRLRLGHDERPPDTAVQAVRQWHLTVRVVGRDGWKGPTMRWTAFVELTRDSGAWLVSAVMLR